MSLTIDRGETYGLVGESGCGKSTLGRALLRLTAPTAGEVRFDGRDFAPLQGERAARLRRRMQMVFQDPMSSLDPRQNVESILTEGLQAHGIGADRTTARGCARRSTRSGCRAGRCAATRTSSPAASGSASASPGRWCSSPT